MATRKKTDSRILQLGNPELQEKLKKAAEAAGLKSVDQLADLLVDSGALALPPSDGITERYTLEDLGKRMWVLSQSQPQTKRAEWFANLAETQRKALIVILRTRGYSATAIGTDFNLPVTEVNKVYSEHASNLGAQVLGLRLDTIAGNLMLQAERAQEVAMSKNDPSTYWRIAKEVVGLLQSLGIVDRAIHRVEVTHKHEDEKKSEIEALVALEEKKRRRLEEIKQADAEVVESLPTEMEDAYEELTES